MKLQQNNIQHYGTKINKLVSFKATFVNCSSSHATKKTTYRTSSTPKKAYIEYMYVIKATAPKVRACRKHGFAQSQCDLEGHSWFHPLTPEEWPAKEAPSV